MAYSDDGEPSLGSRWLRRLSELSSIVQGVIVAAGAAATIGFFTWAIHDKPVLLGAGILAVLVSVSVAGYSYLRYRKLQAYIDLLNSYQDRLASENATCDLELFSKLNALLISDKHARVLIDHVIARVRLNIVVTLDILCAILRDVTGRPCYACVKTIVDLKPEQHISSAEYETKFRDSYSRDKRRRHDGTHRYAVKDNTATLRIFVDGADFWGADGLYRHYRRNEYSNARKDWWKDYDSSVGVGIPSVDGVELIGSQWAGILFADSLRGKLNANELSRQHLQQVAHRLALMMHRIHRLTELKERYANRDGNPPKNT